ncbi:MAG TPA: YIP1 family protein [Anaerolineales bacterium]|nr:YIP1 family protein [Anaerolineales bacterium]
MNMNMPMSNAPAPSSGGTKPFYQIWIDALTKPNEQTFADIASSPNAKATTAYIWVFVGYLVEFFLSALVSGARMASFRSLFQQYGLGNGGGLGGGGIVATLVLAVCGGPILAVIFTVFFAIGAAIVQWVAKMFHGQGTNEQLTYAFAAILAPFAIVAGVLSLFAAIPFVGLCFNVVLAVAGIYALVLYIMAAKGVNRFGWGEAVGSVLIPGLVVGLLCCCLIGGLSMVAGAGLKGLLQQLQQGGVGQ